MPTRIPAFVLALVCLAASAATAQTPAPAATTAQDQDKWHVALYPVFVWVPLGIGIDVTLPPNDDGSGGGGGSIVDGRFDGAYFGGLSVARGPVRFDFSGLWVAVGGDRKERPNLTVDADTIYWYGTAGFRVYKDLFATAGVRRFALKYDVRLGDQPNFTRKPGLWDPLVGVAYHRTGRKVDLHATFEGGGFGVGTDVDLSGGVRVDWRPLRHFGLTAGYTFLYFRTDHTVAMKTFTVKQSLHGPIVGVGVYF